MSFASGRLAVSDTALCVLDRLPNGSVWGATPDGLIAHFPGSSDDVSFLHASVGGSMELTPQRILSPRRPLGFRVDVLKVKACETKALVVGYVESRPQLVVADLQRGSAVRGQMEPYNFTRCEGDFIFNRTGMTLQQVSWWPETSPPCFVVLAGNCVAIYNSNSISVPCATYRLQFSPAIHASSLQECGTAMAFAFFENAKDWSAFAISIIRDDGSVFVLCPVVVPGMSFAKSDALKLLTDKSDEIVQKWHHLVFSRTQLSQSSGVEDSSSRSTIQTRGLRGDWKHSPALQGPINEIKYPMERDAQAILSLSDGILVIGSAKGRVSFASVSQILPVFKNEESRAGAPHVFVLQDCIRTASTTLLTYISDICFPVQQSFSRLCLMKDSDHPNIIAVTDRSLMQVEYSDMRNLISVVHDMQACNLGCIFRGPFHFSAHAIDHLQLKCELLRNEKVVELRSRVQSLSVGDNTQSIEDTLESEEEALAKISDLRKDLRMAYDKISAVRGVHEEMRDEATQGLTQVYDDLKKLIADASVSTDRPGHQVLSQEYKNVLHNICMTLNELDPSAPSSTSEMKKIKDRLECLGIHF